MLTVDTDVYDERAFGVMHARGLVPHDTNLEGALKRLIGQICEIDLELGGRDSTGFRENLSRLIGNGVIVLGTPLLQNIGSGNPSAAACTVLKPGNETHMLRGSELFAKSMMLLKDATGIGFDLSALPRPADAMVWLNEHLDDVNRELIAQRRRPVASMATIRDDHPHIVPFIRSKREVDFAAWRLNISVFVSDALILAAEQDQAWHLRDEAGDVVAQMAARQVLREIANSAHYCGEPGVLFRDRSEVDNPTPGWNYVSTAPCAELAMAEGEACHFSYLNVGKLVDGNWLDLAMFETAATCITRMLDAATEFTIRGRGDLLNLVKEKRRIGVGITGFADLLINLRINYGSHRAAEIAAEIAEYLDLFTKRASVELARQRGPFPAIATSRYADEQWVRRKLRGKRPCIDEGRWSALVSDILKHGVRNSSTTSMPPSGTSSAIVGISNSLEPYLSLRDVHGALHKIFRGLDPGIVRVDSCAQSIDERLLALPFIALAKDIGPLSHLAVQAAFQSFLDDGISKTVNLPTACTVGEVYDLLFSAFRYGLKGVSVFREGCLLERNVGHAL